MNAAELRRAADLLDNLADNATPGPWWRYERPSTTGVWSSPHGPNGRGRAVAYAAQGSPQNAAYIAAMHPGVAKALAAWLRHEGGLVERRGVRVLGFDGYDHALDVARAINGGTR